MTATQLTSIYKDLDQAGEAEWEAMRQRVQDSADPCEGSKVRLQNIIQGLLPEVRADTAEQVKFLQICSPERKEQFFQDWCARIFDLDSVEQEWDLRKKPKEEYPEARAQVLWPGPGRPGS